MNGNIWTNPNRMLGATISADNRTYGLAPARPAGQPETVAEIAVAEAAALQTFPANYRWCGTKTQQFQQIGNAVPPLLAYASLSTFVPEGTHHASQ